MKKLSACSNIGKIMILVGLMILFPICVLPFYQDEIKFLNSFLIPGGASVLLGILFCLFGGKETAEELPARVSMRKSSLTVLFAWAWGTVIGAIPLMMGCNLTIIQGLFEAVSGWTTTGLSVMDVSKTPMIFLFHRSFMQYCGGLGFIMMMIVLVSSKLSMNLYNAEGHPDVIMPNLKKTVRVIFAIYNVCLVLGTIAYYFADMDVFDGICHTMCALSTGGFSTKLNSIGEYNSLSIEIITIILMIIGTTNFAALILFVRGQFKDFCKVSEVRFMCLVLLISIPACALSLMEGLGIGFWKALRLASFDVSSALSTTGYSSMSYAEWPPMAIGILILVMLIGGGIGSTAGGLKMTRVYIMFRVLWAGLKKKLFPKEKTDSLYFVKAQGKQSINDELVFDTFSFFGMYLCIHIIGSLLITVTADCTLTEAMFDFASSMGTVGLSMGITNPLTDNGTLIIEMIGMFVGRLEIFIVFVGLFSGFEWIKNMFRKKSLN